MPSVIGFLNEVEVVVDDLDSFTQLDLQLLDLSVEILEALCVFLIHSFDALAQFHLVLHEHLVVESLTLQISFRCC